MRTMRKPVAILAALAWLGLIVITTPIPFIHLVEWHGFLDTMGIIFLIVAYSGFILAIAAALRITMPLIPEPGSLQISIHST